ncbi:MAG: hypothetical protein LAO78_01135 [Acidobacteriia bacterium]|nr:hypothetical protein [Terriglobia bacterium]
MVTNQSNETLFVVVAKFLGEIREVVGFKINRKGEFFTFPPYARLPGAVDFHSSKHVSGERHFACRVGKNRQPMQETKVQLQPLSNFSGIEPLMSMSCLKGQFSNLLLPGTNEGEVISLDLDSADFNDDIFFVKMYLLQPNREDLVPLPLEVGPRILHLIRQVTPWIAVDLFQQSTKLF